MMNCHEILICFYSKQFLTFKLINEISVILNNKRHPCEAEMCYEFKKKMNVFELSARYKWATTEVFPYVHEITINYCDVFISKLDSA